MNTREQVLGRHSPAVWGLLAASAVFAIELVCVIAWNAWEHRDQIISRFRL